MQGSKPNGDATSQKPTRQSKHWTLVTYLAILCLSFGAYILLVHAMTYDSADQTSTPLRSRVDPNQTEMMKVSPATKSADPGTTFTITIQIEDVFDLGGFQFTLTYDPTCIQVTNVTMGPFLGSTGRSVTPLGPTYETGSLTYGAYSLPPPTAGPNGDGVLATITFHAGANICSSALHLQDVLATNTSGVSLDPGIEDGQVFVGTPPEPSVTGIAPNQGTIGDVLQDVIVMGENFQDGASVQLARSGQTPISASWAEVLSSTQISCTLNLGKAVVGPWDVVVTNPDSQSGTLRSGFTVYGAPTIASITPSSGPNDRVVSITNLAGTNFRTGVTVRLVKAGEDDIDATNLTVVSTTKITCNLDLRGASPGRWTVRLTTPSGQSVDLQNGFTVRGVVYLPSVLKNR